MSVAIRHGLRRDRGLRCFAPGELSEPTITWSVAEQLIVAALVVLVGARVQMGSGVGLGLVAALLFVPCWLPLLLRERIGRVFAVLCVGAILNGLVLTAVIGNHGTSLRRAVEQSFLLAGLVVGVGVIVWALKNIRPGSVVVLFGIGMVAGINPQSQLYAANPWRFGFSVPITVLALGIAAWAATRMVDVAVMLALGAVSALQDARSSFAILILGAAIVLMQSRPRNTRGRPAAWRAAILIGLGTIAVYNLGQAAILDGYLGDATRVRTERQIETAGSLILGGRPEMAASVALISENPMGFGSGTLVNSHDIATAKNALSDINYDPDNGYVERYMFGSGFVLHSVLGDLWANFGILGAALTVCVGVIVLRGMSLLSSARLFTGIVAFVSIKTIWNLPFSPLYSSIPLMILCLGLLLGTRVPDVPAGRPFRACDALAGKGMRS